MKTIPLMAVMCSTCPFKDNSPTKYLADDLAISAITDASRICHSTGSNGLRGRTGKPSRLCRGARNIQLQVFCTLGVIEHPTDEAWAAAWEKMRNGK